MKCCSVSEQKVHYQLVPLVALIKYPMCNPYFWQCNGQFIRTRSAVISKSLDLNEHTIYLLHKSGKIVIVRCTLVWPIPVIGLECD